MKQFVKATVFLLACVAAFAQVQVEPQSSKSADYVLGPGDQLRVHEPNITELPDGPIAIDQDGSVALPFIGRVPLAGLTASQAEALIAERYRQFLLRPDITVSVVEFQSQPVSVLGAVKNPGVQQVRGNRTIVEMLSLAGGLAPDAGARLKITRRVQAGPLPLPHTVKDDSGEFQTAEISLKSLMEARNPEENILVKPNDILTVPPAGTVYVIGNVSRAGPYAFDQHERMTVLEAVSMAGGMDKLAQPKDARILRRVGDQHERQEIAVNLKEIIEGRIPDVGMQSEDILFVPNNAPKSRMLKVLDVAIQMGTGVVIFGRY